MKAVPTLALAQRFSPAASVPNADAPAFDPTIRSSRAS